MPSLAPNQAYNRVRKPSTPITIKGSFSEDDLIATGDESADVSPPESSGWTTPNEDARMQMQTDSAHDLVAELHKSSKISVSRLARRGEEDPTAVSSPIDGAPGIDAVKASPPTLSTSLTSLTPPAPLSQPYATAAAATSTDRIQTSSFAKRLSRRLSYSPSAPSSRSPSPSKSKRNSFIASNNHHDEAAPPPPTVGSVQPSRKKTVLRKRESFHESSENKPSGGLLSRSGTLLRRKSVKPAKPNETSEPPVRASMEATKSAPAVPSLPKSFSTDRLPYASQIHNDRSIPVPRIASGEKMASLGALSLPRKRDELWSIFRSLDGDYTKYVLTEHYFSTSH